MKLQSIIEPFPRCLIMEVACTVRQSDEIFGLSEGKLGKKKSSLRASTNTYIHLLRRKH